VVVIALWAWLARASSRLTAVALGLIIGGAVGNAIDRLHWPGVMDFVLFHVETGSWNFRWYVFNLADVAIVAGVAALLYGSFRMGSPKSAPIRDKRDTFWGVPHRHFRVRVCHRIEMTAA